MGTNPMEFQILLLAAENRLVNEAEVVAALEAQGSVELVRDRAVLLARLRAEETVATLVIADLLATLAVEGSLDGYREFLGVYHAGRGRRPLALLILNPPPTEWPGGTCIGLAELVTGYLRVRAGEPVDVALLAEFVRRIRREEFADRE